jgi:hypothetical protein
MIQRRLRVVKWLSTAPAVGVCTLCSREFKVPMSALTSLDSRSTDAWINADILLRQEPEDEEEEDDRKKDDDEDDDTTDDGWSE